MKLKLLFTFLILFFTRSLFADDFLSFKQALKKYHRHGEAFSFETFHDNLAWDVVYRSLEFREAVSRKYAKDYRLSEEDLKSKLWEDGQEAAKGPEFIVVFYAYNKKWNDLEEKDSIWKMRLAGDGRSFDPVNIVKMKPTPLDQSFYPFMAPWTKTYSVLFPKEAYLALEGDFSLSLFGVKGKDTLRWKQK